MEKLVHIIGFPIISKLIRGETVELSDVCFVPDDQLFNESKNKNFCVKFPIPQTSNTKELAATVPPENGRSQQLQAKIAALIPGIVTSFTLCDEKQFIALTNELRQLSAVQ